MIVTKDKVISQRTELTRKQLKEFENELYNDGNIKNYSLRLFISDLVNEIDAKTVENLNSQV